MKRICVVITARPSYSRVKSVLEEIVKNPNLELSLIVTASALLDRYGNVSNEIVSDGFCIDSRVYTVLEGESPAAMAKTTGIAIIELTTEFQRLQPDAVLTIADRYETIATAISAAYLGIPLIHLQGGEVTGSIDERVRHAITKLSDFHFACTENAAQKIIRMGEDKAKVFTTGCPSIDIAAKTIQLNELSFDFHSTYKGVGMPTDLNREFIVALLHPVTNEFYDSERQAKVLLAALKDHGKQVMWFWPNVDAGSDGTSKALRRFRENKHKLPFYFIKNTSPSHFLEIISKSCCIVGNSSVAIRECSFLGVPAINIGSRQQFRERGDNVIDLDWSYDSIKQALELIVNPKYRSQSALYGDGTAGYQISRILSSLDFHSPASQKILRID